MIKKFLLLNIISLLILPNYAQNSNQLFNFFAIASFSFNIGSHLKRAGFALNYGLIYKFIQVAGRIDYHRNFLPIGAPIPGNELQLNFAIITATKKRKNSPPLKNFFYFNNLTKYKYAIGYSLNLYRDQIGTSQRTGTILLGLNNFLILSENDIFAQKAVDKYRTAAVKIALNTNYGLFAITSIMWTPETKNLPIIHDPSYPARWGYKDFTKNKYGKYSAGILAFEYQNSLIRTSVGINSEWVRFFLQDKLIHDMYFVPKKWNKARNPHYPMLADNGEPYLFKKNQHVKPTEFFWLIGYNCSIFY